MTSILYIGMDVHTTNYTLCSYTLETQQPFGRMQVEPDYKQILKYIGKMKEAWGDDIEIVCGYEAGCLGYSLYRSLTEQGVNCVILAPSTMSSAPNERKTDMRDAEKIAKCLAYGTYSPVYVPTERDESVKEYIRMRDAHKANLKRIKQQIIALCHRYGKQYTKQSHWTRSHLAWLKAQRFNEPILQETFEEYLIQYHQAVEKLERFDKRILELSGKEEYAEKVHKLVCFNGVREHTALSAIVEIGDFSRFPSADHFAAYLGLVPGEHSSSTNIRRTGITKKGNSHLRTLLTESAQCYSRGQTGRKSMALKARQEGNEPAVIAYADKANERLKRKFKRISFSRPHNVAATAVARELACFIWGMMTGHIN